MDISDTIFWFLDDNCRQNLSVEEYEFGVSEEEDGCVKLEENRAFWGTQHQLLQDTLYRTTSMESRVRQATKEALRDSDLSRDDCLRREVCNRLSLAGYNCSLRKSKWRSSSKVPSGEHTYIEVVEEKRGERVIVIVELQFRAEFEMAKAGDDYTRLVSHLPEVFVGKSERVRSLVKILCGAAKTSIKDNNIHMPPWRKHKYMLAKWLSPTTTTTATTAPLSPVAGARPVKPKASMLTFALLESLSRSNSQAVAVV